MNKKCELLFNFSGLETCPKWKTGAWSPCEKSRCFTWNTGE